MRAMRMHGCTWGAVRLALGGAALIDWSVWVRLFSCAACLLVYHSYNCGFFGTAEFNGACSKCHAQAKKDAGNAAVKSNLFGGDGGGTAAKAGDDDDDDDDDGDDYSDDDFDDPDYDFSDF